MACVGRAAGMLPLVAILVAMVLGGISGSGPANAAAVGGVMIAAMATAGYPAPFSASVVGAAAATDILIPPSIAFVVYSVIGARRVGAGAVRRRHAARRARRPGADRAGGAGCRAGTASARPKRSCRARRSGASLRAAVWGLAAPVLILGGMRMGWFTPTEAAVVAVCLWPVRRHGRPPHDRLARPLRDLPRRHRDLGGDHDRAGTRRRSLPIRSNTLGLADPLVKAVVRPRPRQRRRADRC